MKIHYYPQFSFRFWDVVFNDPSVQFLGPEKGLVIDQCLGFLFYTYIGAALFRELGPRTVQNDFTFETCS
jgi:hypothetical protein